MKTLFALALVLSLAACASTSFQRNQLKTGMHKSDVISLLGAPDSTVGDGPGIEGLYWKPGVPFFGQTSQFCVWLAEDRVTNWGPYYCRSKASD